MIVCDGCGCSLLLEDDVVRYIGKRSVLTDYPSIFRLGGHYRYRHLAFTVQGRIQFDYGDGYWDEWWAISDSGEGKWISTDEGDIAIEAPITVTGSLPDYEAVRIGDHVSIGRQSLLVTEKNSCVCNGLEGQLPEVIFTGDRHRYLHCSGPGGLLITLEYVEDGIHLYKGLWVDPFDIKVLSHG
ncbi:MAG: DUF4178 domain-containing protein [Gammaproteobacteria bacterium]